MKIRNSSRITAIVLALVMLLPLISIPTFAEVDPSKIIYSEDFAGYEGLEGADLAAKLKTNWHAMTAKNAQAVTENGNTFMRFPMESMIPEGSEFETEFYLYDGYTKWNATEGCMQYTPSSYNAETGEMTFTQVDGDPLTLTLDTAKAAEGVYGELTFNGHKWLVTTGNYAACNKFGDGYAVDKYSHIYFGECELYTAEDPEVQAGTKKVGDIKSVPSGISYKDHDKVIVKYKLFIEEGSSGKHNMQLNQFANASTAPGTYNQNFVELGNLELSTGAWSGGSLTGAKLPIGEWVEIAYIVDLKNGTVQGVLDGTAYGIVAVGDKAAGGMILSGWTLTKIFKQDPKNLAGGLRVDDVVVLTGDQAGGLIKFQDYAIDFNDKNVGDPIPGMNSVDASYKIAADPVDPTNMVWALGNSNEGTGARDKNATVKSPLFTAEMDDYIVISADYYIPTGAGGQFQTQFLNVSGTSAGATVTKNWGDIFVVRSMNGVATVGREDNPGAYQVPYDTWFTVAVEIQMSTNTFDIYVNDSVAIAGQKVAAQKVTFDALTAINPNSIIMGKQNKLADSYLAGTMYLDNIKVTAGQYGAAFSTDDVWTEDALYANAYAWELTNEEVAAQNLFSASNAFSFPNSLIFVDADEDWTPDAIQLDIKSTAVADDPATEEDETVAEGAIDKMVRPNHVGISTKKASMAVLSANYTVSEDAQGKIQAELHDGNVWKNLFILDADASTIEGVAFTKGEEFTVTVVLDFATGTISTYYNNLLIYTETDVAIVKNGLSASEWSVAKIMKDCETYAGSIIVDDMTITGKLAEDKSKSENVLYLYDQENMVAVEDIVPTTVDAASIRLFAPTGLRFAAKLNNASVLSSATKIGMLIAPAQYVTDAGAFTKEALETLPYVTTYLDVQAEVGNYFKGNGTTANLGEGDFITASIVNILDKNIIRDFAAIAYVEVAGQIYYASEYTVANVQEIAQAAQAAYADTVYANVVNAYANGVKPAY